LEVSGSEESCLQSVSLIILQRLALGLLTLLVVSIVIFLAVELLPGDFAEAILGQGATPEAIAGGLAMRCAVISVSASPD